MRNLILVTFLACSSALATEEDVKIIEAAVENPSIHLALFLKANPLTYYDLLNEVMQLVDLNCEKWPVGWSELKVHLKNSTALMHLRSILKDFQGLRRMDVIDGRECFSGIDTEGGWSF